MLFLFAVFFSTVFGSSASTSATTDSYRVFLENKGIVPFVRGSSLYTETKDLLSDRCLRRRAKVLPGDSLFTIRDAPLYAPYVDDLRKSGATILLQLRWQNYAVLECDSSTAEKIRKKPYVRAVKRTGDFFQVVSKVATDIDQEAPSVLTIPRDTGCGAFRYGPSLTQNRMLGTNELHALGITGASVLMGMIDNGFRWRAHDCFNNLRVLGEYDFMFRDSLTGNDSLDVPTQDGHGTGCLSIAAGFLQDSLIGTAPGVSVLLAKTEDMRYERRIEEDRFAAALEWMESRGVDLTSSSVGYDTFDSTDVSYPYDSLNGRSTICARAVNIATSLGVVCLTAAGNSGGTERTIITPGDADSAFTIGAFKDDSLNVAGFTSKGPNAAGLVKPDFSTLGRDVTAMSLATRSAIGRGSGTSFATPALAGAVALLIDQYPELTPWQVRTLLREVSSQKTPDNAVGYGLPNVMRAAQTHGIVVSPVVTFPGPTYQTVAFMLRSAFPITRAALIVRRDGLPEWNVTLQSSAVPFLYYARIPFGTPRSSFSFRLDVADDVRSRRVPDGGFIVINDGETRVPCGIAPTDLASDVPFETTDIDVLPSAVRYGTPSLSIPWTAFTGAVCISDMLGRELRTESVTGDSQFVSLSGLKEGLYTVSFVSGTRRLVHSLLIY